MGKLTLYDIKQLKGKRQLSQVFVTSVDEAAACEAAGVDMLCTMGGNVAEFRGAAPNVFMIGAVGGGEASDADAIKSGMGAMGAGADAVYTGVSTVRVKAMAQEMIPVVGHIGLVPYRSSWYGGLRAIGKTAEEAMQIYRDAMAYQEAGAIGVEIEVVPHQIATEIAKRVDICLISMGAGTGCDVQYLFGCDVLGTHDGHYPRHAKKYRNLKEDFDRIQKERIAGFKEYSDEVHSGAYPEPSQIVESKPEVLEEFVKMLENE
jgi:3-methyl-2-oxobutanoate hydroxymethyltransferase